MLLSLLLANIRILCLFLFLVILSNFFIFPVVREKIKVKLAHPIAIPTGAPTILVNEIIDTLLLVALKTIKTLSM